MNILSHFNFSGKTLQTFNIKALLFRKYKSLFIIILLIYYYFVYSFSFFLSFFIYFTILSTDRFSEVMSSQQMLEFKTLHETFNPLHLYILYVVLASLEIHQSLQFC
jgi:hypothetical protein